MLRTLTVVAATAAALCVAIPAASADQAAGTITTVAGDGTTLNTDAPPTARAKIRKPRGVAVDRAGNKYFSEYYTPARLMKIDAAGVLTTVCGNCGGLDLAVASNGDIYSADDNSVHKITPQGAVSVVAGDPASSGFSGDGGPATSAKFHGIWDLALDDADNLYIADVLNSRVRKVDAAGIVRTIAGGGVNSPGDGGPATASSLGSPFGLAIDHSGNVFIAASGDRIRMIDTWGNISTVAGNGKLGFSGDGGPATSAMLSGPFDVSLDDAGNLYFIDQYNLRIRRVDRASHVITTVAGNGSDGYSGDNGPATDAAIGLRIEAIAVEPGGRYFYFGDTETYRVRRVDIQTGRIITFAGTGVHGTDSAGQATAAPINTPWGVAFDGAGNQYIADSAHNFIRKVGTDGMITVLAGTGERGTSGDGGRATLAKIDYPLAVTADAAGTVYFSGSDNRVRKIDTAGVITTVATLNGPRGLAADAAGNLYAAEWAGHRVVKVTPGGTVTPVAGTGTFGYCGNGPATTTCLANPAAVALDSAGTLYIADFQAMRVRKVAGGTMTTVAGDGTVGFSGDFGPATQAKLNGPTGVTVDRSGTLYIADTGNNRVRQVAADGRIRTIAGNGTAGFSGDNGPARDAALNGIQAVAADPAGAVHIADAANNRIRRVVPVPLPPAPVAKDDSFELSGTTVTGNVLANDTGDGLVVIGGGPAHSGTVKFGSGTFVYTPAGPWVTSDWFTYTVQDSAGQTASATVYLGSGSS
ncbi:Ig-like domain-containing protein [Amycolatopsis sp. NPDC059657]|uniref:NHL domain-containing protein n=1 Tax=Amycolatopsis sp. NPDC059657 TaxID=3346899 RepID=UPI00366B6C28